METIGKITGSHGVRGQVVFEHHLKNIKAIDDWDALLIELIPDSKIPFFIESAKWQTDTSFLVKFEEINSPEHAKEVLQKNVYLSPNVTLQKVELNRAADNYIGYLLFNGKEKVGTIDNILNPKTNPLFILFEDTDKELLIPANEELILEVIRDDKKVIMELPEGLV